jgi:hypothetical protein
VPSNLIARPFGFEARNYFELADAGDRAVPPVSLR